MRRSKIILALAALASVASFSSVASAHGYGPHHYRHGHHHPRQQQLVMRSHHQIHRINHEYRQGHITRQQAHAMKAHDRAIIREVHADARANGGHITPHQQRVLNQQMNANGHVLSH